MLAGLMTVAGQLLLLAVALGCSTWRCMLGAGAAPLTLFLSYGYVFLSLCRFLAVKTAEGGDEVMPASFI